MNINWSTIVWLSAGLWLAQAQAQEQEPAVVSVAPVKQLTLAPTVMVSGQVQSKFQSNLTTGVDGRLDFVLEPGSKVAAGDVLARLDPTPLKLRITELNAQLKRASIQAQQLQREVARLQSLIGKNLVSKLQLEQTQADYELALADIELNKASVAQLQEQLNRSELKAPFAGVVSQRFHQIGEEISRSSPLIQLVNLEQLEIRVYAPLQYAGFVTPGAQLQVFDPRGEHALPVTHVIPVSDNRSQTFELRLAATSGSYQIGQLVSVGVPVAQAQASLVIHRDALVLSKQHHAVYRVDGDIVHRVEVDTGQGQGAWLQVRAALQQGDQLVIRGAETLTDGAKVRVLTSEQFQLVDAG